MFQRRHYEALAEIVKEFRDETHCTLDDPQDEIYAVERLRDLFVNFFKRDNGNFNPEKFIEACKE